MNRSSRSAPLATDDDIADRGFLCFPPLEITSHKITLHTFVIPEKAVAWLVNHTANVIPLDYFLGFVTEPDFSRNIQKAGFRNPVNLLISGA